MLSHFLRARYTASSSITFVGVAEASLSSGNSFTATYPSGTQNGDLAFIAISAENNLGENFTASGWTSLNRTTTQGNIKSQLLYTVVSGTGSQSFTKGGITTGAKTYLLAVFRNATYSSFSTVTSGSGVVNPPSLSGTFNAVVCFGHTDISDSTVTAPTGYTTLGEISNGNITTCGGYLLSAATNPDPAAFGGIASSAYNAYTIGLT